MANKAIILGASTTGKTTLVRYLKEHTSFKVSESDDELTSLNNGIYPSDTHQKINILAPKMVKEVLNADQIIFFTNTHYFTPEDLVQAKQRGFVIVLLILNREIMEARSKMRQITEGYEDHTKYFDSMLDYISSIQEDGLIDFTIDSNRPVQDIAEDILKTLV